MNDARKSGRSRKGKLAESIAELIQEDIKRRGWPVGEVLGNEPQLQERYGVSRATIREAIRQLERHGVASMRRGKLGGLVVEQPAQVSAVMALATYIELADISFDELFEARQIVESMALEQAGQRFSDKDIAFARECIEELKSPLQDFSREMALQTKIRNFLRDTAQNPATAVLLDALYYVTINDLPPKASKKVVEEALGNAREIRAQILEALVGNDPAAAKHWQHKLLDLGHWLVGKQIKGTRGNGGSGLMSLRASPDNPSNEIFNKTAQRLALAIIQSIKTEGLKPGDRLGTETELQEKHEVSRAVLREALRILELHCILVSKRGYGGGLVVSAPNPDYTVNMVVSFLQHEEFSPHYFFEVWKTIQLATSRLAAERITEKTRAQLQSLLKQERLANPKKFMVAVRDLEMAISEISGNRPLALFTQVLSRMAVSSYPLGRVPEAIIGDLAAKHQKVVEAICAGEAGLARRSMAQFLDALSELYRPRLRESWRPAAQT